MLIDGRSLPDGERIETDLCIIGCGPAGMTVASQLAAPGLRLTVIESGGPVRDRQADRLGAGQSVGHPYGPIQDTRARGVGGTSLHWQMHKSGGDEGWIARPLDPLDFEVRPGLPHTGWPITWGDLEPYYRRAQEISGLGPFAYQPASWPNDPDPAFDLPPDRVVTNIFQRGPRRFSENGETVMTSPDVRLIHNATVQRLVPNAAGTRLAEAIVATDGGRRFSVAARRFILAAGGIDNPRLLLASSTVDRGGGLGNEHDLVGRFFMERLSARAGVIVPADAGIVERAGLYRSHLVDGTRIQGVLSLAPELVREQGLRNAAFWVRGRAQASSATGVGSVMSVYRYARRRPLELGSIARHVVNIARDLPDVVRTSLHHALRRPEGAYEVFQLGVQAEQAPNPESRVTLGSGRDRFGGPLARLDWQPTEDDRTSIRRTVEILDTELRAAGIGHIVRPFGTERPRAMFVGNWHHMGTTRMDADPSQGVVDPTGRVHSLENLFVAGSSVFPTAGFANPTLTIVALAVRLADEFRRGGWGDLAG